MEPQPLDRNQLRRMIADAFAGTAYPGDAHIAQNLECCDECRYTDDFFRGQGWQELAQGGERLPTGWGGLSFLTPEAWRFYLPAYLLAVLRDGQDDDAARDAAGSVMYLLTPPGPDLKDYFQERVGGLSAAQRRAIAAFVDYQCRTYPEEYEDERPDLVRFWHEPATET